MLLISTKGRADLPILGLQRGGLSPCGTHKLGRFIRRNPTRFCYSNWRLPSPTYVGHPALCCLDFPLHVAKAMRSIIHLPRQADYTKFGALDQKITLFEVSL